MDFTSLFDQLRRGSVELSEAPHLHSALLRDNDLTSELSKSHNFCKMKRSPICLRNWTQRPVIEDLLFLLTKYLGALKRLALANYPATYPGKWKSSTSRTSSKAGASLPRPFYKAFALSFRNKSKLLSPSAFQITAKDFCNRESGLLFKNTSTNASTAQRIDFNGFWI